MQFIYLPPTLPSEAIIKTHYRSLCKVYHPDKGGDAEIFRQIKSEYDFLEKCNFIHPPPEPFEIPNEPEPMNVNIFGNVFNLNNPKHRSELAAEALINLLTVKFKRKRK